MTAPAPAAERARQLAEQVRGPLKAVEDATKAREKAEAKAADADAAWRQAIANARAAGCAQKDVAAAAKVHRTRVWQLLRGPVAR